MLPFLMNPVTKYAVLALVVVLAASGSYIKGQKDGKAVIEAEFIKAKAEWELKISEAQQTYEGKAALLEEEYKKSNKHLQDQLAHIRRNPILVRQFIPQSVDKAIPKGFVELHDRAAKGQELGQAPADAEASSGKVLSEISTIVADNYLSCNQSIERLKTLQAIVKEFQQKQREVIKK